MTAEHQHGGGAPAGGPVGAQQPPAVPGAHRAAGEAEAQKAHFAALLIADVAEGPAVGGQFQGCGHLRYGREEFTQGGRGGQPDARFAVGRPAPAQFGDPYRAVHGGPADRPGPGGQDLAGFAAQPVLGVAAMQEPFVAQEPVMYPGTGVGGAQGAQHGLGRLGGPVDAAVALPHGRAGAYRQVVLGPGGEAAGGEAFHRQVHRLQGGVRDLTPVDLALAGSGRHGETGLGPHRPGVQLRPRLKHRHPPARCALLDRPVQGRRAPRARPSSRTTGLL